MRHPSLPAARIDFSSGVPRSVDYGDVYHSAMGAREQAFHVFLSGNGLPQRWRGHRHFRILETGFGLGHNFLATWAAWAADPDRCQTLHFVSLERHPPCREDLARAHLTENGAPDDDGPSHLLATAMSQALIDAWPPLLTGLHTLELAAPGLTPVQLTLALSDARRLLPQVVGSFDAFFLDGFAPRANPELWDPWLLRALGRLAARGATAATWSVARTVRDGLKSAGFEVERAPGLGTKREMSVARFAPRAPHRAPAGRPQGPWTGERQAVVIGAGLAGACAAQALARQGWQCTVLDAAPTPASGASGNPAGLFHGVVHRDDGVHARLHRHAALGAARYYAELIRLGAVPGRIDGLLAVRNTPPTRPQLPGNNFPPFAPPFTPPFTPQNFADLPGYVCGLSQEEASAAAAAPLGGPALHFLQGGWVDPGAVVRHALATPGVRFQGGAQVGALVRATEQDPCWKVLDTAGAELARAPLVVLAAGVGLPVLARPEATFTAALGPLEVTRGQITWFASQSVLARPVSGHGYAASLPDGRLLCGASLRPDDENRGLDVEDQRWNLERLKWLTGLEPAAGTPLGGRVSWRLKAPDRLPLIGPVPKLVGVPGSRQDQVRFIDRQPGLYVIGALGSRGLIWAPLAAQMLCAWVEATPMPLEAELLDALDPARWLVRQARRQRIDEE